MKCLRLRGVGRMTEMIILSYWRRLGIRSLADMYLYSAVEVLIFDVPVLLGAAWILFGGV